MNEGRSHGRAHPGDAGSRPARYRWATPVAALDLSLCPMRVSNAPAELRRGDFDDPKRRWGLTPVDPFTLPERRAPDN